MSGLARTLALAFLLLSSLCHAEHLIVTGGPTLRKWENLRVEADQHDRWWANFVRASTVRMAEIRKAYGSDAAIVWMVYQPSYQTRGREDGKPYLDGINFLVVPAEESRAAQMLQGDAHIMLWPGQEADDQFEASDVAKVRLAPGIWTTRLHAEKRSFLHDPRKRQCTLTSLTSFHFVGDRLTQVSYSEPAGDLIPTGDKKAPFSAGGAPEEHRP